jgi:hypothetical protein
MHNISDIWPAANQIAEKESLSAPQAPTTMEM